MVSKLVLFLCVFCLGIKEILCAECVNTQEVVCYFGSWAIYREDEGQFTTENIEPNLCTTIIYSFVGLDINLQITSLDVNADISLGGFSNLTNLKTANPCLKTSLALGGWNEGSLKYSIMSSTEESRNAFADNALKFIAYYGFDGLDLDWEYPTARGGIEADKSNFVALLKAIKDRFSPYSLRVSIAVGLVPEYYDIKGIAEHVDFVHLMGYDLVNKDSNETGLQAPFTVIKNQINNWISSGLPANKLILGLPAYARCFNLADINQHDIGAPVNATTCGGVWTDEDGFMAFYEVQDQLLNGFCQETKIVDDNVYSWCKDVWMTYDNTETIGTKVKYAVDHGLGGVMLWSMDTDDFNGMYDENGSKYTLLKAINEALL